MNKVAIETTEQVPQQRVHRVYVNPLASLHNIVSAVVEAMQSGEDIVSVIGLPKRVYCFKHPDAIAKIFLDRDTGAAKYTPKIAWLHWFFKGGGTVRPLDNEWKMRRRAVQPSFSHENLQHILPIFQSVVEEKTKNLYKKLETTDVIHVDMLRECWEMIVDASFKSFFSTTLGEQLAEITDASQFLERNFIQPIPLWLPLRDNIKFKRSAQKLRDLFKTILMSRKKNGGGHVNDVLNLLIAECAKGTAVKTDEDIVDEMSSLYFGMCVMAIALAWAMYRIAKHKDVQNEVYKEALSFSKAGPNFVLRRSMGYSYTDMVFLEVARLNPPVWGLPRLATAQIELNGFNVPPNSVVVPMVSMAHRDERFWPKPLEFNPNRFLRTCEVPDKIKAYFPFGLGMRRCAGASVAPFLMQIVPLVMLNKFEIEFTPRFEGDPQQEFGFEIVPKNGLPTAFRKRTVMSPGLDKHLKLRL